MKCCKEMQACLMSSRSKNRRAISCFRNLGMSSSLVQLVSPNPVCLDLMSLFGCVEPIWLPLARLVVSWTYLVVTLLIVVCFLRIITLISRNNNTISFVLWWNGSVWMSTCNGFGHVAVRNGHSQEWETDAWSNKKLTCGPIGNGHVYTVHDT